MNGKTDFSLVLTIVNRGHADEVMNCARQAGAKGGTVLYAHGAGIHETETFFGISIRPEKELVMILVPEDRRQNIMHAIVQGAGLNTEGKGITFSLPVTEVAGIAHLMSSMEKENGED